MYRFIDFRPALFRNGATFVRKCLLILLSELVGNAAGYLLLGCVNRVSGRRLTSVFLVYPAHPKYVTSVTFAWYAARGRWQPRLTGVYTPGPGQWGLVFAVSSSESALTDPANLPRLQSIVARLERIGRRVGARNILLSGILPGYLRQQKLRESEPERAQTAMIVEQAVHETLERAGLTPAHAVIVLGSAGFIGSRVCERLRQSCRSPLIGIDTRDHSGHADLVAQLEPYRGQPALLVNISRHGALEQFIPALWPQVTILNEVFPEADKETRARLRDLGIDYFHLSGVRGFALPRFTGPYAGAIPCCALSLDDIDRSAVDLVIKLLN